ncbi:MAG TPA: diguanylate cyclase [Clostridiaceae bacterium]
MKIYKKYLLPLIILLILIVVVLIRAPQIRETSFLNKDTSKEIKNGWEYSWQSDGAMKLLPSLPSVAKGGESGKVLTITNTLPTDTVDDATLFLRTSQQFMKVFINDKLIYSYPSYYSQSKIPGSSFHFIKLPQGYQGGKLKITLVSAFRQYLGNINSIYIGSKSTYILNIIYSYGLTLVIGGVILFIGLIIIALFFVLRSKLGYFKEVLYLGAFSILTGIWIISESKIIQLIYDNPIMLLYSACLSLFLLCIPMILFILTTYKPKYGGFIKFYLYLFSIFFLAINIAQIYNASAYMDGIIIFHGFLLLFIITIIIVSIRELISGNKSIKAFCIGFIILGFTGILDLTRFYFPNTPGLNAQFFTQFGILIFILMLTISLGHIVLDIYDIKSKSEMYETLAYTDIMTGLKNRTSYEMMINRLNKNLEGNISVIIFDLDGLKEVNDGFGHSEGDNYICRSGDLLKEAFETYGEVYRIGGDEFATIIKGHSVDALLDALNSLQEKIEEKDSKNQDYKTSIAYGMASYKKDKDNNLNSVIIEADEKMYEMKRVKKGTPPYIKVLEAIHETQNFC